MISIIIPIYNEEKVLLENAAGFKELSGKAELIFADGGSSDRSAEIAGSYGKILQSRKGRALQMNCGAKIARGNILLFLHSDTMISQHTLDAIEEGLRKNKVRHRKFKEAVISVIGYRLSVIAKRTPNTKHREPKLRPKGVNLIGGCLTQRIHKQGFIYRLIENFGNIRARRTKVFYGDQGIFVKKDIFVKTGGFPEVPVMEDILFSKRLRKLGQTGILPAQISVSARRWEKKGILRTILFYASLNILFWLRVPSKKIASIYDDLR